MRTTSGGRLDAAPRSAASAPDVNRSAPRDTKRKRFIKAVKYYLLTHREAATRDLRFDVVSVSERALDWEQNAFDAGNGW